MHMKLARRAQKNSSGCRDKLSSHPAPAEVNLPSWPDQKHNLTTPWAELIRRWHLALIVEPGDPLPVYEQHDSPIHLGPLWMTGSPRGTDEDPLDLTNYPFINYQPGMNQAARVFPSHRTMPPEMDAHEPESPAGYGIPDSDTRQVCRVHTGE